MTHPRPRRRVRGPAWWVPSVLLIAGCGTRATTVELAAPLSPAETERLIHDTQAAWSRGGEIVPPEPPAEEAEPAPDRPRTPRQGR